MASHSVTTAVVADSPQVHEDLYVHAIYDQIAPHFSSTRYKVSLIDFTCPGYSQGLTFAAMAYRHQFPIQPSNRMGGIRFRHREWKIPAASP